MEAILNSIQKRVDEIFERETEVLDSIHDWKIYEAPKDKSEENKRKAEDAYNREIANQLGGLCSLTACLYIQRVVNLVLKHVMFFCQMEFSYMLNMYRHQHLLVIY